MARRVVILGTARYRLLHADGPSHRDAPSSRARLDRVIADMLFTLTAVLLQPVSGGR